MREAGCLGAFLGGIFGVVSGACLAMISAQGDELLSVINMLLSIPISGILFVVIGLLVGQRLKLTLDRVSNYPDWVRIVIVFTLIYLGCLGSLVYLARRSTQISQDPPSDEVMLAHFAKNRTNFETLQQMATKDGELRRVDYDWTDPDNPEEISISAERIGLYRELCQKAGIPRGFNHYTQDLGIEFIYWGKGSAISDDYTKGFLYTTKPPKPLHKTLNTHSMFENGFRHIEGNWYIYYEYIPE
ncbi:MAG: hypothetical protein QM758_19695 [Armatimonas sp.]